MKLNKMLVPVGALAITLSAGGFSADAAQRGDRGEQRGRATQGPSRERSREPRDRGGSVRGQDDSRRELPRREAPRVERQAPRVERQVPRVERQVPRVERQVPRVERDSRGSVRDSRGNVRADDRVRPSVRPPDRRDGYRYYAPRIIPRRLAPRRYYGSGGHLSVYYGLGSGYLYGSPYYGRVYGYARPSAVYGARRYFGDIRLHVRPRGAAVYVDGYYAGIVDDFDGIFQRLTLDVGPHQIEIAAPGFEPLLFDVYVDPTRTVDLHGNLVPGRP